ncbi:MAG: putative metal-binding protein [Pyrinomonadaceae bacterium]
MHEAASKAIFDSQVGKLNERLLQLRGWVLHSTEYPILDVSFHKEPRVPLRVRLICDNWDEQPPSIQFLSLDGNLLTVIKRDPAGIINESPHPSTGRPFVCAPGSLEYHTHSSHIADLWSNYKNQSDFDLGGILTKLWSGWKKIPL